MSEAVTTTKERKRKLQYRGRGGQALIYIGKLLRGFVYQSDWKVFPMAALIAGVVSMVVRNDFFLTMEGTLKGALALTCTSIWNGCFNSIQVICREREIIKREHRSGLHISAYIFSHMFYQALICLGQTALTLYICKITGIQFPKEGLFTPWLMVDLGITIFLITYASDMLSLWISCIAHNTTTAMTVMPFILIFQLVFSGGIFTMPAWANKFAILSISNYGMKCIMAQSKYNELPLVTGWNSLMRMENQEINTTITLGQVMDFLSDDSIALTHDLRSKMVKIPSAEEVIKLFYSFDPSDPVNSKLPTLSEILALVQPDNESGSEASEEQMISFGEVIDELNSSEYIQSQRDASYTVSTTLSEIMEIVGREKLQKYITETTAKASHIAEYDNTRENIIKYWGHISVFAVVFAFLAMLFLEFVDKDKR